MSANFCVNSNLNEHIVVMLLHAYHVNGVHNSRVWEDRSRCTAYFFYFVALFFLIPHTSHNACVARIRTASADQCIDSTCYQSYYNWNCMPVSLLCASTQCIPFNFRIQKNEWKQARRDVVKRKGFTHTRTRTNARALLAMIQHLVNTHMHNQSSFCSNNIFNVA